MEIEQPDNRIHEFTIIGEDAWHEVFLFSTLEEDKEGNLCLKVINGDKTYSIDITDQEVFIKKISILESINKKEYVNPWVLDGQFWALRISYDNRVIISKGDNAAPSELIKFFSSIGIKINIYKGKPKRQVKDIEINEMKDTDDIFFIGNLKAINRNWQELASSIEAKENLRYRVYKSDDRGRIKVGTKGSEEK